MAIKQFAKLLLTTVLTVAILFLIMSFLFPIKKYTDLIVLSILFFSILSCLTYAMGESAIKKQKSNSFIRIVMINVMTKLFGSFAFMIVYYKIKGPDDQLFLLPFLMCYLVFLISETYFLNVQARSSKIA